MSRRGWCVRVHTLTCRQAVHDVARVFLLEEEEACGVGKEEAIVTEDLRAVLI